MSVDQSTMTPTEIRLVVWRNGYNPLALNGKIPGSKGWQNTYDLDEDYIRSWATSWPSYTNTGILTKPTPCLDLDVLNPELVEALEEHIHDQWIDRGPILRRVGKAPKLCIPFRSESPFKKIRRDLIAPDGSEQKIEFLADGQQFVAFGIHPETHKPYSWHGHYSPLTVSRDELPYIHQEEAEALVDELVKICEQFGYRLKCSKQKTSGDGPPTDDEAVLFDWADHFANDQLAAWAMALLRSGMIDGAVVNFLRAAVRSLKGVDEDRRQRRLDEIPGMVSSARHKLDEEKPPPPPGGLGEWSASMTQDRSSPANGYSATSSAAAISRHCLPQAASAKAHCGCCNSCRWRSTGRFVASMSFAAAGYY